MSTHVADKFPKNSLGPTPRLIHFAHMLRSNGYSIDTTSITDSMLALEEDGLFQPRLVRRTLQSILCKSRKDIERFDELFDAFWLGYIGRKRTVYREVSSAAKSVVEKNKSNDSDSGSSSANISNGALAHYFEWRTAQSSVGDASPTPDSGAARLGGGSSQENLSKKDFGKITDLDEAETLLNLATRLGTRLRYKKSRRRKASLKKGTIDLRRSLQKALVSEGIPWTLQHKVRRKPLVSLVTFVDVSGSMDSYSLFFARFMQALLAGFSQSEAFLFHTRLVYVSDVFREANAQAFMDKMGLIGQGWSGGTQIGDAIKQFNSQYARKFLHSRTVVIMMTDGYDTNSPEILEREMRRLKSRSYRVIWLNPLMGREQYSSQSAGAQTLERYSDCVAPCHNIQALQKIEDIIAHV